jgi:hypothetical protein
MPADPTAPSSPITRSRSLSLKQDDFTPAPRSRSQVKRQGNSQARTSSRSKSYKHQRKTKFQPRKSRLDSDTLSHEKPEFRGFYVLFWITLGVYMLNTFLFHWRQKGELLRTELWTLFHNDLVIFALSDAAMVCCTFIVVPIQWLVVKRWLPISVATALKHFVQTALLLGSIRFRLALDHAHISKVLSNEIDFFVTNQIEFSHLNHIMVLVFGANGIGLRLPFLSCTAFPCT